jgi:hypothetical protein
MKRQFMHHTFLAESKRKGDISEDDFDWLACYDQTSDRCYYIPSNILGSGRSYINLRLIEPKNKQASLIRYAEDFLEIS